MIRVAFYAPMKAPDDPLPSGDRAMARGLISALEAGGMHVDLASRFKSRESSGNADLQAEYLRKAQDEVRRVSEAGRKSGWQVWLTYHNYYKAPDLIGPFVAELLGIPYLLAEATRARKRLTGPWERFAQAAETACDAAKVIFFMTRHDEEALRAYAGPEQQLISLRPFLSRSFLPAPAKKTEGLLSVGMFRRGDKIASYALIAQALTQVRNRDWTLDIAGDGPARSEVEALFAQFGSRVRFLGALDDKTLQAAYARSTILVWPGVNEAFGMSYLEAQAHGLAVVAQDRPGVRDVVFSGAAYPRPEQGPGGLADRLDLLLSSPKLTWHIGQSARAHIEKHNLISDASATLLDKIQEVVA
ncbi:MAG: glycosyltransferase family 4 protein [Pseudomonadota bacterium]